MASTISFAGMSSGLDTDAIVEVMVSNYKLKADNSAKQQLLLEWKQDIYKDVSKKVYSFYTGIASKLRLESTFNKKLLTTSNTTAIKLDNTSTVPSGTHTLSNLKMATSAQMQTYKMGERFDANTTIKDLGIIDDQSIEISEGTGSTKKVKTIKFVDEIPKNDGQIQDSSIVYIKLEDKISVLQSKINESLSSATINFNPEKQAFSVSSKIGAEKKEITISDKSNVLDRLGLPSSKQSDDSSVKNFTLKKTDIEIAGQSITTSVSGATTMIDLGITKEQSIIIRDSISNTETIVKFVDDLPIGTDREKDKAKGILYIKFNETISDVQSALKSAMPSATINFDSKVESFFISSKTTGKEQKFDISGGTEILKKLGFTNGLEEEKNNTNKYSVTHDKDNAITTISMSGSDAEYTYNGIDMTSSSNNVSVNGLKFSIISNTDEKITLSSNPDVDGMASTIKSFVEEYNTLISELNDLINADSAGSYEPLLDEEKEGMTDSQIEKWEKKIKDSLLRNDSTLKSLTTTMRSMLSGTLSTNSTYKSLSSIGITTSSDWTANGKLELDEDKLKEALTNNADEIIALFSANSTKTTVNKNEVDTTKGLGDRIYDALGDSFKRIANVKSATSLFSDTLLTKQRTTQAETTNKLEDRLDKMREIYLKRFTAMETALSKLNSQTDALTSLLSS